MLVALYGEHCLFIQEYGWLWTTEPRGLFTVTCTRSITSVDSFPHEISSTCWAINIFCSNKETGMTLRATLVSGINRILFKLQSSRLWRSLALTYQTTWGHTQGNIDTAAISNTLTPNHVVRQLDGRTTHWRGLDMTEQGLWFFLSHQQAAGERRPTRFETNTPAWRPGNPTTHTSPEPEGLQTLQALQTDSMKRAAILTQVTLVNTSKQNQKL